jgi:hypothetical protein
MQDGQFFTTPFISHDVSSHTFDLPQPFAMKKILLADICMGCPHLQATVLGKDGFGSLA